MAITKRDALDAFLAEADELLAGVEGGIHTEPAGAEGRLFARLGKERNLELQVRLSTVFGTTFISLVDFEPSTGISGAPVLIERELLGRVIRELKSVDRYLGGTSTWSRS